MKPQNKRALAVVAAMVCCFIAAVTLVLTLGPTIHAADEPKIGVLDKLEHFEYTTDDDGNITLDRISAAGQNIANNCTELHVNIPEGVTKVNGNHFPNGNYSPISFFSIVKKIGQFGPIYDYDYADKVTAITFPSSLKYIGDWVHGLSKLTFVDLSHTQITKMGKASFASNTNLTKIVMPANLTELTLRETYGGDVYFSIFSGCPNLTNIICPNASVYNVIKTACQKSASDSAYYDISELIDLLTLVAGTIDCDKTDFTYTGKTQNYSPDGYNGDTMILSNASRKEAGTQSVSIMAKSGYIIRYDNQYLGAVDFTFTIAPATITVVDEIVKEIDLSNLTGDFNYQVKLPDNIVTTVDNCQYTVTYDTTLHTTPDGNANYTTTAIPVINGDTVAGEYYIYYQVTAQNHQDYAGVLPIKVKRATEEPDVTPTTPEQPSKPSEQNKNDNLVAIIGGTAAGVVGVAAITTLAVVLIKRKKH